MAGGHRAAATDGAPEDRSCLDLEAAVAQGARAPRPAGRRARPRTWRRSRSSRQSTSWRLRKPQKGAVSPRASECVRTAYSQGSRNGVRNVVRRLARSRRRQPRPAGSKQSTVSKPSAAGSSASSRPRRQDLRGPDRRRTDREAPDQRPGSRVAPLQRQPRQGRMADAVAAGRRGGRRRGPMGLV